MTTHATSMNLPALLSFESESATATALVCYCVAPWTCKILNELLCPYFLLLLRLPFPLPFPFLRFKLALAHVWLKNIQSLLGRKIVMNTKYTGTLGEPNFLVHITTSLWSQCSYSSANHVATSCAEHGAVGESGLSGGGRCTLHQCVSHIKAPYRIMSFAAGRSKRAQRRSRYKIMNIYYPLLVFFTIHVPNHRENNFEMEKP